MGARWYDQQLGRWISPDTIIPQPANPQSFNRYSYVRNAPLRFTDPSGMWEQESEDYTDPDSETLDAAAEATAEYTYQSVKPEAYAFYCANFASPFEGTPEITEEFGAARSYAGGHRGVDYGYGSGESFTVRAAYGGTVTYAGENNEAGMWKVRNTAPPHDVQEWSAFVAGEGVTQRGLLHYPADLGADGLYEPQRLLNSGYTDDAPSWSHTVGTTIIIDHGHNLRTEYQHVALSVATGDLVSPGDRLGTTTINGWSSGNHLHYAVVFSWGGRSEYLNPVCSR